MPILSKTSDQDAASYLKTLGYGAPDAGEIQGAKDELDPLVGQVNGLTSSVDGLIASSKSARADFTQTSSKLDGRINTTNALNYGAVTTDPKTGKTSQSDINGEGAQAGMGYKFAYQADGTKVQIPEGSTPEQYGMSANAPSKTGGAKAGASGTTPEDPYAKALGDMNTSIASQAAEAKAFYDDFKIRQDSTVASLIDSITKKYDARRAKMEDINARMLEGKRISGIQAGRQRYAPNHEEGLLSAEEMDGQARLAEIDAEELSLIAQAKQARDDASYKSFNNYMGQLDKLNGEKLSTVTKLQQLAIDQDKAIEQKRKDAITEKAASLNYQQDLATSYAGGAYAQLQTLKTDKEKEAYIAKLAQDNSIDPEVLKGAIEDYANKEETQASQIAARESAATSREQSLSISEQRLQLQRERQENGGTGTAAEKKAAVFTGFQTMLSPEAQPAFVARFKYGMIDDEGFFTPEGLTAMLSMAQQKGISRAEFLKEFSGYIGNDDAHKYKLTAAERKALEKE